MASPPVRFQSRGRRQQEKRGKLTDAEIHTSRIKVNGKNKTQVVPFSAKATNNFLGWVGLGWVSGIEGCDLVSCAEVVGHTSVRE